MHNGATREVVVVTGASAGVGRAIVRRFARDGARIGLIARGHDGLVAAEAEARSLGGEALALPADVADPRQVEAAAQRVEQEFGPIDVWINNAMVSVFSPVAEMSAEEYRRVTEVTYLGVVHGTLAALRRMRPRDRGMVLQIGSALAYRGIPLQSAYCAAKHAIQGFNDSLRCELLHERSGVRLTMVQLPGVNTPQFDWVRSKLPREPQPIGTVYQPGLIADAVHHAAHHDRREWIIGHPALVAIVGDRIAPELGDRYLARRGVDEQQGERPVAPDRRDNLWAPLPGDHGARGRFDRRARTWSLHWWLSRNRRPLALAAAGCAAAAAIRRLARA